MSEIHLFQNMQFCLLCLFEELMFRFTSINGGPSYPILVKGELPRTNMIICGGGVLSVVKNIINRRKQLLY